MSAPQNFSRIPVVDISPLRGGSPAEHRLVANELGKAAREVGFLYVSGSGVSARQFDDLLAVTKKFFAQPREKKMEVYIGRSRNHRGYVPEGEEVFASGSKDKKEAFDLSRDLPADDPDFLSGNPLLGPNQWPELPGFREAVTDYYNAVFAAGKTLMRGFALALGEAPDFFDRYITRPPSQLRLIHYPFDSGAEDRMGIGAHTDYECFTLLKSTSPGLEVMNGAGEWIDAPPMADALTVNIGDLLELWTNGEFVATSHRVRKVKEERYSFPLFFTVDYQTYVKPLERFAARSAEPREGLTSGEHLYAQTVQTFAYLQERLARGEIRLPEKAKALSSFGQAARVSKAEGAAR